MYMLKLLMCIHLMKRSMEEKKKEIKGQENALQGQ